MKITSKNNEKIKELVKLLDSPKKRAESGLFVVEGLRLCYDAILTGLIPKEVYYTTKCLEKNNKEMQCIIKNSKFQFEVSNDVFAKISKTVSPQGIICVMEIIEQDIVLKDNSKFVVLENLSDPSNLGAISRTAEALGVDGMFVCGGCDIYNPKALRASMGSLFRLPVKVIDSNEMFEYFSSNNIKTFASTPKENSLFLNDVDFSGRCAVFIGNEANGLSELSLTKCDKRIKIFMSGRAESLNAASAASILIYCMTLGR